MHLNNILGGNCYFLRFDGGSGRQKTRLRALQEVKLSFWAGSPAHEFFRGASEVAPFSPKICVATKVHVCMSRACGVCLCVNLCFSGWILAAPVSNTNVNTHERKPGIGLLNVGLWLKIGTQRQNMGTANARATRLLCCCASYHAVVSVSCRGLTSEGAPPPRQKLWGTKFWAKMFRSRLRRSRAILTYIGIVFKIFETMWTFLRHYGHF